MLQLAPMPPQPPEFWVQGFVSQLTKRRREVSRVDALTFAHIVYPAAYLLDADEAADLWNTAMENNALS